MPRVCLFVALLLPIIAETARAQSAPASIPRLNRPLDFDGRVDASEWGDIPKLPLTMYSPNYGADMSLVTELRVAYDDEYLYYSARCLDPNPPTMTTYRRDNWSSRDDQIAIGIDSFDDHENSMVFVLYATGARVDAQLANDGRQQSNVNTSWNTYWDALVEHHEGGWDAEVRIPLSSLRFETPQGNAAVTMGISAYRFNVDLNELYQYPGTRPDWGFWSFLKPSKSARRTMTGITSSSPLYIAPYVTGGLGQSFDLNDAGTAYERSDEPTFDAGLDVKYSLTSNLTVDLTANTDFAQVEADNQQVNLTRFSLFFPEKRQFFLERTSNFDFSFGGNDRVFYSRRVGLASGEQVRLLGGGRLVGRVGEWDVGLLNLQTGRQGSLESENFGVLRLKRQALNANSYFGGIVANRVDLDGTYNATYGIDGQINVRGDDYLLANWAQSFQTGTENTVDLGNSRLRLQYQRARATGLNFNLGLGRAGADYNPGVGFQRRSDYTHVVSAIGYGVRPDAIESIQNYQFSAGSELFYRNEDGSLESAVGMASAGIVLASDWQATLSLEIDHDDILESFSLSDDVEVPAGTYTFAGASLEGESPGGNRLQTDYEVNAGRFYDGNQFSVGVEPNLSITPKIAVGGSYEFNRIRFDRRGQALDAHILRLRADLMANTRLTISAFVQWVSEGDVLIANGRLRYNPRDGNDFYLVWNQSINTDRLSSTPQLPFSTNRTLLAKYTHTFRR